MGQIKPFIFVKVQNPLPEKEQVISLYCEFTQTEGPQMCSTGLLLCKGLTQEALYAPCILTRSKDSALGLHSAAPVFRS